ncbi:MAG: hypothetical protein V9F02_01235 [Chitinophagaceae bacterium]
MVNEITGSIAGSGYGWVKVVALCGITILLLALLRGFFFVPDETDYNCNEPPY